MKKITLLIATLLVACAESNEIETIFVDMEKAVALDLSGAKVITIQEDSVYFSSIVWFEKTSENYLLNVSEKLLSYDLEGRFVSEISCMGRANDEYTFIFHMWTVADTVFLYDMAGKILSYKPNGEYIKTKKFDNNLPIRGLCWFQDGYVVETSRDSIFCFYDNNFEFKHEIKNITLPNQAAIGYCPFNYKNQRVLEQKAMEPIIYTIDSDFRMEERYHLDFGSKTLPKDLLNDMPRFYQESQNYVVTHNSYETDESIVSLFSYKFDRYINKYNKKEKMSTCFKLPAEKFPVLTSRAELVLSGNDGNGNKTITILTL